MNFKTTSILFVLLLAVGTYIFLTRDTATTDTTNTTPTPKKLLSINSMDLASVTVTPADGKVYAFTHVGADWSLTKPVESPAESGIVQAMVNDLTNLQSLGTTAVTEGTGLSHPRFVVDLVGRDGKTTTLNIGDRSGVGDQLYVQVKGNDKADTVAAGVDEQLDKPIDDFRQKKLVSTPSSAIKYIAFDRPAGKMELAKDGETWKIISPEPMAADGLAVTELLTSITNLQAAEFVDGTDTGSMVYGLASNAKTITIATAAPSTTQPTTQPAPIKITVGLPDTVLQKNLYATVSNSKAIVKVAKDSLSFIDKKPLDLRDKTVLDIDPKSVNSVTVKVDRPATTKPTTKPAETKLAAVVRRPPATKPATEPTTGPATTQASTKPVVPPVPQSTWVAAGWAAYPPKPDTEVVANDSAVEAILSAMHPLKAVKYVETAPTAGTTVTVTIKSGGGGVFVLASNELQIVDPGDAKPPVATYHGLHFEIDRALLDKLEADFAKPGKPVAATPEPPAETGPQMMP